MRYDEERYVGFQINRITTLVLHTCSMSQGPVQMLRMIKFDCNCIEMFKIPREYLINVLGLVIGRICNYLSQAVVTLSPDNGFFGLVNLVYP